VKDTICAVVDWSAPDGAVISRAAEILRQGGLVAFPTETVYGLGADASNGPAVAKIYKVKGRPSDNPLIWHGVSVRQLEGAAQFSGEALRLAEAYWPGPLTLVLNSTVPGSGETVAVRVPSHPVTRELIEASGCIIAAPSANLSGRPSPTRARHVIKDLGGAIEMIIDGGPSQNGLESTVVDLHTEGSPRLLRPGAVTPEMIKNVLGKLDCPDTNRLTEGEAPLSPGMKYRHYAPQAPLILLIGSPKAVSEKIESYAANPSAGIFRTSHEKPEDIAKTLFDRLRGFDDAGASVIIAEGVKEEGIGLAIMNRLKKAAAEVIYL
jgi:L-threonylcarbamoyladenylate synthase